MHTKGPWVKNGIHFISPAGKKVITSDGPAFGSASSYPDADDNARLIIAAPELLEALEEVVAELKHINSFGTIDFSGTIKSCDELIAKAKGQE